MSEQARTQLQLTLPDAYLEQKLDAGQAVLLLDGLDEVGSAADREGMRERVQAFCRNYPKVPLLVTSRIAGYEDTPLPRQGSYAFVHLTLAKFNDKDLRLFVKSWYAVQEANDPMERDRGVVDLTTALEADARVRELAKNPMLATLIALVHRFEAHLPGERAALYDICVKTLLETWPASRRRTFQEIDTGLQRAYLETLAFRMQGSRSQGDDQEVVIERDKLVVELVEIVRGRGETSEAPEATRGLVERWVRFLEEGTGILVEQRAGVFAFFHLSLMEYLAARGMEKAEDLDAAIVEWFKDATWREVCLLAVGSHATEKTFLDQLFISFKDQDGGWSFLLRCLREEAAFDDGQRASIVRGVGRSLLGKWPHQWEEDQSVLADVMRFSMRHAEWANAWVPKEVAAATGEELRGVVALRRSDERLLDALKQRTDATRAAADLLEYWPESRIGEWAASSSTFRDAFEWSRTSSPGRLVTRSLKSLADTEELAPGFLLGLLGWVPGITASFLSKKDDPDFARYFLQDFAQCFVVLDFGRNFGRYFSLDFTRYFARYFAQGFPKDFFLDFARYFAQDFDLDFEEKISLSWVPTSVPKPDGIRNDLHATIGQELVKTRDPDTFKLTVTSAIGRLAAEASIAMTTTVDAPQEERLAYVHHRVLNAWLLQVWPAVDRALPDSPHPNQLALYLTLGFTQATTTWQWPATERWITLLGVDPPDDWLPRSQWHLCWLLHDPEDASHRQAVDEALDEGLGDARRPGVAEELRKLIPRKSY